jgi:hypothetical protein
MFSGSFTKAGMPALEKWVKAFWKHLAWVHHEVTEIAVTLEDMNMGGGKA